ncbi:MAG: hypothetical protein LBE92_05490 [Chryseobacterium sp.]|jgi:hypothetical protein|uniref:hypothetical protein n=1 Tax=Chryseobacterium sp. TaxID=1871047 RepID=UPI00283148B5|nr:hypothetical protein [Chryseobacterium sp.]MDR2235555.1 hypothetical protein [Chryseobacterium sp.]
MEIIYEKPLGDFSIRLVRNVTADKVDWETLYIKNDTKKIISNDKAEKNAGWKLQEERGESPVDLYNIAGTFYDRKDKSLYLICNRFGEVILNKYAFEKDTFVKKEAKVLAKYLVSGGFGKAINTADIIKVKDKIYFTLTVGQSGIKKPTQVFTFNPASLNSLKKIEFSTPSKTVKTVYINEFGTSIYEQEKDNAEKKEIITLLKNNLNRQYFFISMPGDSEQYEAKSAELHDYGIASYNLFLKEDSEGKAEPDPEKMEKAGTYINEMLKSIHPGDNKNRTLAGYLYDNAQENILYFLTEENGIIEIIRYNNYTGDWLLGSYAEKNPDAIKQ